MIYLGVAFFCNGILFGNFNAMALEPLGHIAGVASAVVGSLTTFLSLALGTLIGRSFDGTVLPLVGGFAGLGLAALAMMRWAEAPTREPPAPVEASTPGVASAIRRDRSYWSKPPGQTPLPRSRGRRDCGTFPGIGLAACRPCSTSRPLSAIPGRRRVMDTKLALTSAAILG